MGAFPYGAITRSRSKNWTEVVRSNERYPQIVMPTLLIHDHAFFSVPRINGDWSLGSVQDYRMRGGDVKSRWWIETLRQANLLYIQKGMKSTEYINYKDSLQTAPMEYDSTKYLIWKSYFVSEIIWMENNHELFSYLSFFGMVTFFIKSCLGSGLFCIVCLLSKQYNRIGIFHLIHTFPFASLNLIKSSQIKMIFYMGI